MRTLEISSPVKVLIALGVVRFTLDVQFWFPIWYFFLIARGFSPQQASMVDASFYLWLLIAEIPMGWFISRMGRSLSIKLSVALSIPIFLSMGFAPTFPLMVTAWSAWGILWALNSGLDTSYTWELAERGRWQNLPPNRVIGIMRAVTSTALVTSYASAGWIFELNAFGPYVLTAVLGVLALPCALVLPVVGKSGRKKPGSPRLSSVSPAIIGMILLLGMVVVLGTGPRVMFQAMGMTIGASAGIMGGFFALYALAHGTGTVIGSGQFWCHQRRITIPVGFALMCAAYIVAAVEISGRASGWVLAGAMLLGGWAFGLLQVQTEIATVAILSPNSRPIALSIASAFSGLVLVGLRPTLLWVYETCSEALALGVVALLCAIMLHITVVVSWKAVHRAHDA